MINLMCEEKRIKIYMVEAGNAANSGAMDKFFLAPYGGTTVSGNEKQMNFKLFNLCKRFIIGF